MQMSEMPAGGSLEQGYLPNTLQPPAAAPPREASARLPDRRLKHWAIAAVAVCAALSVAMVAAMVFAARSLAPQLAAAAAGMERQADQAQAWGKQTEALQGEAQALREEVERLRQYIASSAHEDTLFLKIMVLKPNLDRRLARVIARHVRRYAALYEKDANLILAIMSVESDFNPRARSRVGALGLMQVMPQWKKVLGVQGDLDDPETSIRTGLQVLGFYTSMYRDLEMALTAYNRGPGPVDMALMRSKDPKNGYSTQVLRAYETLKAMTVSDPSL